MVKSGSFKVEQGNLGGRIGSGIGKGLADQLPKEIQQGKLAAGLQRFQQEAANLSPLEQATRLFSIPGITPQMVQVLPELLRQQNIRNAYQNRLKKDTIEETSQPLNLNEAQFGQLPGQIQRSSIQSQQPNQEQLVNANEIGQPQIAPKNPVREEALPKIPLTQDEYLDLVAKYADLFPHESPEQWERRANEEEQRRLNRPLAFQEYDKYLTAKRNEIESEFQKELERHLQKQGPETFKDIPGDLQSDALRTIERRLKSDRNLSVADAVKEGVNQLFEFSKAKSNIDTLATKGFLDFITPSKRDANYSRLKTYANIYDKLNRNNELFQKLKSHSTENNVGFGLSPQEAAAMAYPTDKIPELQKYIDSIKPEKLKFNAGTVGGIAGGPFSDTARTAASYAINIEKYLQDQKASPLAIAREIRKKDPNFNQHAFFDQLRQDDEEGKIRLWPFQRTELTEGESDVLPSWGDLWFLPFFK